MIVLGPAKVWKLAEGNWAAISSRGTRYAGLASQAAAKLKVGLTKKAGGTSPKTSKGNKKVSKNSKLFKTISGIGAVEDIAVGFVGAIPFRFIGFAENAVPATRILQGVAGHVFNRRGKRHLVDGIMDFIDNWLLQRIGLGVRGRQKVPVFGGGLGFGGGGAGVGLGNLISIVQKNLEQGYLQQV